MEPDGVHLIEPGVLVACGYLYPTGAMRSTYFGAMHVSRCGTCGATFDSTDFTDHDIIRVMDDLDRIDLRALPTPAPPPDANE